MTRSPELSDAGRTGPRLRAVALSVLPVFALGIAAVAVVTATVGTHRRPNVLLVTVDTLRPDRLSAYGYQKHRTPHADRLAAEGTLFENAYCDVPWTTPSMASVMTGRYATAHGMRTSFQTLRPEATTIAELLRAQGYRTAAIIASLPLHSIYGLDQGFDLYDEEFSEPLIHEAPSQRERRQIKERVRNRKEFFDRAYEAGYRPDGAVTDRALRWLKHERHDPFFLWVHYFGPHEKPLDMGDLVAVVRTQLAHYDPDVVSADGEVGRLLAALDDLDLGGRTLVILHSDHGQSLLEHNDFGHGRYLYDPTQRIPLIIRWPRHVPAGKRVERMVKNLDIFATILDATRIDSPASDGDSLLLTHRPAGPEATYVETYLSTTWFFAGLIDGGARQRIAYRRLGYRTPRWKLVINDPVAIIERERPGPMPISDGERRRRYSEELYDLTVDPGETVNVITTYPQVGAELRTAVWRQQSSAPSTSKEITLDATTRERLRALGYLAD